MKAIPPPTSCCRREWRRTNRDWRSDGGVSYSGPDLSISCGAVRDRRNKATRNRSMPVFRWSSWLLDCGAVRRTHFNPGSARRRTSRTSEQLRFDSRPAHPKPVGTSSRTTEKKESCISRIFRTVIVADPVASFCGGSLAERQHGRARSQWGAVTQVPKGGSGTEGRQTPVSCSRRLAAQDARGRYNGNGAGGQTARILGATDPLLLGDLPCVQRRLEVVLVGF